MTAKRGHQQRMRKWHVCEKATIDHLVRTLAPEVPALEVSIHPAITASGLVVEDQVRKTWPHNLVGLAIF